MDRDDLEWRFVKAGATADADEEKRGEIIRAYVLEKTGVGISRNAAANFEPYLTQLKDAAVAMPALKDDTNQPEVAMCAVFPPDPNRNQRLEMERILQLRTTAAYGTHDYSELRETLSYDDAVLISLLHESGHCMDRFFFPQLFSGASDPASVHAAESYAETMAVFLMAREGRDNVAGARAYLRDLYSYFMEPYFQSHPELGIGSDTFAYGGLIYHLSPSIRAAAAELAARPGEIAAMPLPQLQELAKTVVDRSALDTRVLSALYAGYAEGHDAALERYRDYEARMPDLFLGIVDRLQSYWHDDESFRASAFHDAVPAAPATELAPFDRKRACALLEAGDYEALRSVEEELRQDLRKGSPGYEAQRSRFELLSQLWKELPAACRGKGATFRMPTVALPYDFAIPGLRL